MKLRPLVTLVLIGLAACKAGEPPLFELRSPRETGITFANTLQEDDSLYNPIDFDYIYNGAGVAVGDFNNNGYQDVFFAGNMVSSRLYLNHGDFRFEDVTEAAGLTTDVWATGVSVVDINQNGLLDIYLSVAGPHVDRRANLLFVNQGPDENGVPRFTEEAEAYGLADTGYTTHAVFFDYDGDGLLDVYLLNNALELFSRNMIRPRRVDGSASSTDRLYRNNGDGTFTDVSREAGILIEGYGLGVVVSDLNENGLPDIFVSNDFQSNSLVWINNGDGTFTNRAAEYLKSTTHNGMGADIADFNNNGFPDIIAVDMLPRDNLRKKLMLGGSNYDMFHLALDMGYHPQYTRNTLQLHNGLLPSGDPSFSEIGQLAGVHDTDWSWAAFFADFDNSGWKDLFISNGYRRDVTNLDFIAYGQETRGLGIDDVDRRQRLLQMLWDLPDVKLPNYIFRNDRDLTFADVTVEWGLNVPSFSTGAVFVDLNNDGDLDLVVSNIDGEAFVFENRSERFVDRNFLRIQLNGPQGNLGGYGAKVYVRHGGQLQYHYHSPYRGYKSSNEQLAHFGLGAATSVDSLEIVWPDGSYQLLTDVAANQVLDVRHADAGPRPAGNRPAKDRLFERVPADNGLGVVHRGRRIADFKHTPLLPHKHTQGGPGIAVGDVTGNGLDDVYLGADKDEPKQLLLQVAPGRFEPRTLEGDEQFHDMGALFFDANQNGHLDLYVVSGGGHLTNDHSIFQDRLYLNDGHGDLTRADHALPEIDASGSCVVGADFTGNGRIDLFVCGRIRPGEYPMAARSYLLRNDSEPGGAPRFTDVTGELAPGLAEIGLASSALWTDFDGDGLVDLIVVGEWMPITFLRNVGGRLENVSASTGLGRTNGWWNSIVAGDFTNNGRIDYVVGNLGKNSEYQASEREPVRLHAADFNSNGRIDPILSYYIQGRSHVAHPRDVLIDQMLAMKGRFPTYTEYGSATFDRTLSREERDRAEVFEAVIFDSVLLENQGDGRFAMRPLPIGAQLAPIFGMLVNDFDGDGNLDVLLTGNSHATDTRVGWYTASTGGMLRGDGAGNFEFVDGVRSGFHVDGDAKAVAEVVIDDERSLVLVSQNRDSMKAFSLTRNGHSARVRLEPGDTHADLTFRDGRRQRREFHHGSTYLSQSSRFLNLPAGLDKAVIHGANGKSRVVGGDGGS
jgi:enediyne biosynthesis protein E4